MEKIVRSFRNRRWYGKVPITLILATAIGLLVLVTVSIVFGVGVWIAQRNTFDLLGINASQGIAADVNQIEQHLLPAEYQTNFLASQITSGKVDPANQSQLGDMLVGALSAAPQIEAVMFINTELKAYTAGRDSDPTVVDLNVVDYSGESVIRERLDGAQSAPTWGPPTWREQFQRTYLNRVHPVSLNGEYVGVVVAVVSVQHLSEFISEQEFNTTGSRFILYGRRQVLAHWMLMDEYPDSSDSQPLPLLEGFGDPILASIWQTEGQYDLGIEFPQGGDGHILDIFNEEYAFVYRPLVGYGPSPMIVGTYFPLESVAKEVRRMMLALYAGFAALILSLIAAIIVGRRIAKPIVRFSSAAGRVRDLDVSKVEELPGSVFRELNDQSIAFNSMLRALRWFELYVPKKIVERLIKDDEAREAMSDEREITVMFTDIVGFSAVSEDMSAAEVAKFVNHHFSLIADCIEAEEGTIDKFMGDAVMAFWGAPDRQSDSAERACRAALAIADVIKSENRQRDLNTQQSIGIRIGIHTGMATVGNIGSPGRLNYTIIGDTVNIGQRLEQLGKDIHVETAEVTVLLSGATAEKLSPSFTYTDVGSHQLIGRSGEVRVFRLLSD